MLPYVAIFEAISLCSVKLLDPILRYTLASKLSINSGDGNGLVTDAE